MAPETAIGGEAREFPATRWTLILSSRGEPQARRAAMEQLVAAYWKPLYCFARRKGMNIEAAKDAVQDFTLHLLEQDFLDRLDPGKGKFRSYLRTAFDRFMINQHESRSAQKRGGGAKTLPLDFDVAERDFAGAAGTDPGDVFDREWAVGVMERTETKLRGEFRDGTRSGPLELFLKFFRPGEAPSYAEGAKAGGMSESQLKAFLHRTRVRFRELVREEVAQTVTDPGEIEGEISELLRALSG